MKKNNAALSYYIQSWLNFIGSLPLSSKPEYWHKNAQPKQDDPALMSILAWEDLDEALQQYTLWQKRPSQQKSGKIIWEKEGAKLRDFGGDGLPILMVPSMINGYEIFHMPEPANLLENLKRNGFHPIVLDWGAAWDHPPSQAQDLSIAQYQKILKSASDFLGKTALLGYCLGGTLAHFTHLKNISRQVLLGAPWQFQHDQGRMGEFALFLKTSDKKWLQNALSMIEATYGQMPSLFVDYFFAALNPLQFVQKFRARESSDNIELFDAVEDWLNSGRNLPVPLCKELIFDWFREDALVNSQHQNNIPTLAIYGQKDHIAPPKSCQPIEKSGKNIHTHAHDAGHIGLLVGKRSQYQLWPAIIYFLKNEFK